MRVAVVLLLGPIPTRLPGAKWSAWSVIVVLWILLLGALPALAAGRAAPPLRRS